MVRLRLLGLACILALPGVVAAQDPPLDSARSTRAGVYTASQATRGREIYELICASCHTPASHTGPVFAAKWDRHPLWDLYRYVSESMPKSEPGSLTPREYARVVAYLLKMNGMPAGKEEIPADSTALKKIRIELKADSAQMR
jgi:mono/diheme cytochrome c family protein